MKPQAVYDTNVIVSAILKPRSIPASLVSFAMTEKVQLFLSPVLLAEYTEVVKRPVFGFNPKSVNRFLKELENTAVMVYPTMWETAALDEPDTASLSARLRQKPITL